MNYFAIVSEQIEIFAIYLVIGIVTVKAHILDREKLGVLSGLITKLLLPLIIFTNAIGNTTRQQFLSSLVIVLLAGIMYLFLILVATILAKLLRIAPERFNIYRACSVFGNCGFMGIPIITALCPDDGGLYLAMYSVMDQVFFWTVGMHFTAPVGEKHDMSILQSLKKMVNPAIIAIVCGIFVVLSGIKLPGIVVSALSKTGAAASPLAMIYLGGSFCYISLFNYLKCKEIYVTILVKMCLLPILVYKILGGIPELANGAAVTISVLCALPTMASVAMVAETQHSDSDYAAGFILITTVLSVVTLPLVCLAM